MRAMLARLWTVIRGLFSRRVRDLEWRNPEVVLGDALDRKRNSVNRLLDAVAGMSAAFDRQRTSFRRGLEQLQAVEAKLRAAVGRQDVTNGPRLLAEQKRLARQVEQDRQALEAQERELELMKQGLKDAKSEVQRFDAERSQLVAQIRYQQARHQVQAIWDDFFAGPEDRVLQDLRDRVQTGRHRMELAAELNGLPGTEAHQLELAAMEDEFRTLCRGGDADDALDATGARSRTPHREPARLPALAGLV